jgi:hypothetical protein
MNLSTSNFEILEAFEILLTQQRQLFTAQQLQDLDRLISSTAINHSELEDALVAWVDDRPDIDNALQALLYSVSPDRGPGGIQPPVQPQDQKNYREILLNAVRLDSPQPPDPQPSNANSSNG